MRRAHMLLWAKANWTTARVTAYIHRSFALSLPTECSSLGRPRPPCGLRINRGRRWSRCNGTAAADSKTRAASRRSRFESCWGGRTLRTRTRTVRPPRRASPRRRSARAAPLAAAAAGRSRAAAAPTRPAAPPPSPPARPLRRRHCWCCCCRRRCERGGSSGSASDDAAAAAAAAVSLTVVAASAAVSANATRTAICSVANSKIALGTAADSTAPTARNVQNTCSHADMPDPHRTWILPCVA